MALKNTSESREYFEIGHYTDGMGGWKVATKANRVAFGFSVLFVLRFGGALVNSFCVV